MFFVLHGIVMLMKQHSYAFYNGYLSTVYFKRLYLLSKLKQLDLVQPSDSPSSSVPPVSSLSTSHLDVPPSALQRRQSLSQVPSSKETDIDKIAKAIASREALDGEQIRTFEKIIKWEVDALADELRGTASDASKAYPNNLTFMAHYAWIPLPTLVYELEYPRSEAISWRYVAEKLVAVVGVLLVMNQVAQYSICSYLSRTGYIFPFSNISCRPCSHEDGADERRRTVAWRSFQRISASLAGSYFSLHDGILGMVLLPPLAHRKY